MVKKIKHKVRAAVSRGQKLWRRKKLHAQEDASAQVPRKKFAGLRRLGDKIKLRRQQSLKKMRAHKFWTKTFEGGFTQSMRTATVTLKNRRRHRKEGRTMV